MSPARSLPRRVEPELLDALAAADPAARRSRHDLRRLHHAMGTVPILLHALDRATAGTPPRTLLELGAGDGSLMLRLAQRRAARWPGVAVTLLDRQPAVDLPALRGLQMLGWGTSVITADVFDGLEASRMRWDLVVATLFVHHFPPAALARLFAAVARRTRAFVCCEPRRGAWALVGSHLVGLLGAGPVTREDAVLSVHAGFRDHELAAAWPADSGWRLHDYPAGLFSQCLLATRTES